MKRLFIILAVMAVVFGCTEQQHPLLRQVWGLIEVNPESAKVVLAKVHTNSLTERDKAEYGLLKTILISKTHGIYMVYGMIDNDSLISASIAYYNQHGDEWHRGHAYYYRGAIRMSKLGNMPGAVKDFKVAEMISEDSDDEELKNLVYNSLHYVNIIIDNQSQALKYAHKWLDSSIELKDSMKILRGLFNCATAYADMDQKDSAYTYISKCLQLKKYASRLLIGGKTHIVPTGIKQSAKVTFSSSDRSVAVIDKYGNVVAKKRGIAVITITTAETAYYAKTTRKVTIGVVPNAVKKFTAQNGMEGVLLVWDKVAGATGYNIYRNGVLIQTTIGSATSLREIGLNYKAYTTSLTNGKYYTYKIAALNKAGESTKSKTVSIMWLNLPKIKSSTASSADS